MDKHSQFCLIFVLLILTLCLAAPPRAKSEPFMRFTGIKCTASLISLENYKCFIKAYSFRNTTMNMDSNITHPIYGLMLRYSLSYKELSNRIRPIIINATIDLCEFTSGVESNKVMSWIVGLMKGVKEVLHPCPYQGRSAFDNFYFNPPKTFLSVLPGGKYLIELHIYNKDDPNIITLVMHTEMISNDRKPF